MPKTPLEKRPEAELDVMPALWTHTQPVRTARLLEDLADKAWPLSTLKVLLGRLAKLRRYALKYVPEPAQRQKLLQNNKFAHF